MAYSTEGTSGNPVLDAEVQDLAYKPSNVLPGPNNAGFKKELAHSTTFISLISLTNLPPFLAGPADWSIQSAASEGFF